MIYMISLAAATVLAVFVEHLRDRHSLNSGLWWMKQLRLCLNDDCFSRFHSRPLGFERISVLVLGALDVLLLAADPG